MSIITGNKNCLEMHTRSWNSCSVTSGDKCMIEIVHYVKVVTV